jgi:hypothetical protein
MRWDVECTKLSYLLEKQHSLMRFVDFELDLHHNLFPLLTACHCATLLLNFAVLKNTFFTFFFEYLVHLKTHHVRWII